MVETQIINNSVKNIDSSVNIVDSVKDTTKEALYDYAIKYLVDHTFINSKNLGSSYIYEEYNLTPTRTDYTEIRKLMSYKFRCITSRLITEGKIAGYSSRLYKRVDITKPVIDTNEVHLMFYQGRFVNPKFYDLE